MDRVVLLRLIMSQNSIFLPVVANGFLFYLPYIKWNLKKKSCQKSLGILVSLATVSATPEYGVFWVFSLILPVIIQNALPLLYN